MGVFVLERTPKILNVEIINAGIMYLLSVKGNTNILHLTNQREGSKIGSLKNIDRSRRQKITAWRCPVLRHLLQATADTF